MKKYSGPVTFGAIGLTIGIGYSLYKGASIKNSWLMILGLTAASATAGYFIGKKSENLFKG